MDELLKKVILAAGISGYEGEIAGIMKGELEKTCETVMIDAAGNVIGKKGKGKKKIMIAAHMDEIGLLVKHVTKEGFIHFIKIGGIDDRVLLSQRVVIKTKSGDITGIIGSKPPHLSKEEERKQPVKYEDMFIDIGAKSREEALARVSIGDQVILEPNAGVLNGSLCYGKAIDNRVGCYGLLKIMEKVQAEAEVYAVATVQEEVGLKGARVSAFRLDPDFALALDTTIAGDTPGIKETESALKLGAGVAITIIEAGGRGVLVSEKVKNLIVGAANDNKIPYQIDVIEGGMTDGAVIHISREGIPTGVLSIPTRYIHSSTGVFSTDDVNAAVALAVKVIETVARG
jgi:endoglucanase